MGTMFYNHIIDSTYIDSIFSLLKYIGTMQYAYISTIHILIMVIKLNLEMEHLLPNSKTEILFKAYSSFLKILSDKGVLVIYKYYNTVISLPYDILKKVSRCHRKHSSRNI